MYIPHRGKLACRMAVRRLSRRPAAGLGSRRANSDIKICTDSSKYKKPTCSIDIHVFPWRKHMKMNTDLPEL